MPIIHLITLQMPSANQDHPDVLHRVHICSSPYGLYSMDGAPFTAKGAKDHEDSFQALGI